MGGILQLGKFDMTVSGWYAGIDPDDSTQFTCENFPPSGYNYSRYCNSQMQAAQSDRVDALRSCGHESARTIESRSYCCAITRRSFTAWLRQMEPISVDFHGFDPNPVVESWNAWQWSI